MLAEVKHGVAAALWLAPLGVPLRVELRGIGDAAAVTLACRGWDGEPDSRAGSLELTLALDPAVSGAGTTEIEIAGRRLALAGAGVRGGASADRRHAWCALSSEWLEAPERLRSEVLEPLVLFLLARNGRTPLHAAVLGRDDLAIMLMCPSGPGKRSIAHAA
jgi:hypothetical protein